MLAGRCRGAPGAAFLGGTILALAVLFLALAPQADAADCPNIDSLQVPGAVDQDKYCLDNLTTDGLVDEVHTSRDDWSGLHASETRNPEGPIPGIQIDGYFTDDSTTNCNNSVEFEGCHDAQFVMRFPNDWNGKLVITGAPGVRGQYALDFIFSDWLLARGYAFASTDKGNTGVNFFRDGTQPGDAVAEWHERVEELTRATKDTVDQRYGRGPSKTYITGISNGGYLTRYALENTPELYDGGVDWEGTLFRQDGPNLFTYLPSSLRNYPGECQAGDEEACRRMFRVGFQPGSKFLWDEHYAEYWDLTQRIYREEFDPDYDGALEAGIPFCQEGTPNCDANYVYKDRPPEVKNAVGSVSLTGDIGKPMLTLHGTLDALLPIKTDSNVYRELIEASGDGKRHRYYKIEDGTHVDSYYDERDESGSFKNRLRPILPCHRAAFKELEEWVEKKDAPPVSKYVERPKKRGVVNRCTLGEEATYRAGGG
jgi:predicted esterase